MSKQHKMPQDSYNLYCYTRSSPSCPGFLHLSEMGQGSPFQTIKITLGSVVKLSKDSGQFQSSVMASLMLLWTVAFLLICLSESSDF